jgi:hypothetical protein
VRPVFEVKTAFGIGVMRQAPAFMYWVFRKKTLQQLAVFLLFAGVYIALSILYPVTNIDQFSDLGNYYYRFWVDLDSTELGEIFVRYEPGFVLLSKLASQFMSFSAFLWLLKFILLYAFFLLLSRESRGMYGVALLAVLGLVYYLPLNSLASLVIRQGIATAILFYFLSTKDLGTVKFRIAVFWVLLMISFHYSSFFVLVAMLMFFVVRGLRPFAIWLVFVFLYCVNFSGHIGIFAYELMGLSIDSLDALNTDTSIEYTVGFKLNFLLLSIFFIVVPLGLSKLGWLAIKPADLLSRPLFRFYLLLNSLATIFSLLPFHDRFFMWSWVLGPALIVSVMGQRKPAAAVMPPG